MATRLSFKEPFQIIKRECEALQPGDSITVLTCLLTASLSSSKSKASGSYASRRAQNFAMNACGPSDCEFKICKLFNTFKQTNKKG